MQTLQKKNFFPQLKDLTISSFCLCCRFVVALNNGHKVDFSSPGLFFLAEKRARESKQETGHWTRQGSTGIARRARGKEEKQKIVEWDDRKHFSSSFLQRRDKNLGAITRLPSTPFTPASAVRVPVTTFAPQPANFLWHGRTRRLCIAGAYL